MSAAIASSKSGFTYSGASADADGNMSNRVRIIEERKLPILDGFLSKDDKICVLHIVSLRMKHFLSSNFHPKEEMLTPRSSR
jgi:hypothetical protein